MELTIKTPFARLTVDVDPAQALHLVQQALNCATSADLPQPAPGATFAPLEGHPPTWEEEPEAAPEPVKVNGPVLEAPAPTVEVLDKVAAAATEAAKALGTTVEATATEAAKALAGTPKEPQERYGGFLYVQCEACKSTSGYKPKQPIFMHKCDCGHRTILKNVLPAYVRCKCGSDFKYRTNILDRTFTINCLTCGAPVDMELNGKETAYLTVGESTYK